MSLTNAHDFLRKKRARRTISTGQGSRPGPEAETDMGRASGVPPTEDADGLSATNSEVGSAVTPQKFNQIFDNKILP